MDQHRTAEDELLHFEGLQRPQQAFGPSESNLLIERAGVAAQIVVGGEMDHRSYAGAVRDPHAFQRAADALFGSQVDANALSLRGRRSRSHTVKSNETKTAGQPVY